MNKFFPFLLLSLLLMMFSCGGNKSSEGDADGSEMKLVTTMVDTLAVDNLVREYMDQVIAGNFDSAVEVLRFTDPDDAEQEPIPLTQGQKDRIIDMLNILKVNKYEISDVKFNTYADNEVIVKAYMGEEAYVTFRFRPVKYLVDWFITLRDTDEETQLNI